MTPKVTLDTNCLIALREKEPGHEAISSLFTAHKRGQIELRLVAISATDLIVAGGPVQNLADFHAWVIAEGFGGIEIVLPLGIHGLVFYGGALLADDEMTRLYQDVGRILFPGVYPQRGDRAPSRSQACDVLMMWSHIYHHGDIFATTDRNFTKATKKPKLAVLGAGKMLTPTEALEAS